MLREPAAGPEQPNNLVDNSIRRHDDYSVTRRLVYSPACSGDRSRPTKRPYRPDSLPLPGLQRLAGEVTSRAGSGSFRPHNYRVRSRRWIDAALHCSVTLGSAECDRLSDEHPAHLPDTRKSSFHARSAISTIAVTWHRCPFTDPRAPTTEDELLLLLSSSLYSGPVLFTLFTGQLTTT